MTKLGKQLNYLQNYKIMYEFHIVLYKYQKRTVDCTFWQHTKTHKNTPSSKNWERWPAASGCKKWPPKYFLSLMSPWSIQQPTFLLPWTFRPLMAKSCSHNYFRKTKKTWIHSEDKCHKRNCRSFVSRHSQISQHSS